VYIYGRAIVLKALSFNVLKYLHYQIWKCMSLCNALPFTKRCKCKFRFSCDITTSSELRIGSEIYIYIYILTIREHNTTQLTELPHYIKIRTMCCNIINTLKTITYVPHAALIINHFLSNLLNITYQHNKSQIKLT